MREEDMNGLVRGLDNLTTIGSKTGGGAPRNRHRTPARPRASTSCTDTDCCGSTRPDTDIPERTGLVDQVTNPATKSFTTLMNDAARGALDVRNLDNQRRTVGSCMI